MHKYIRIECILLALLMQSLAACVLSQRTTEAASGATGTVPDNGGDSNSNEDKLVTELPNGVTIPTNNGPLFTVDKLDNIYAFSGGTGAATPVTGFAKTTPERISATFLDGKQVLLLAKDPLDGMYVFVFTTLNGSIASHEVDFIAPSGEISTFCSNCETDGFNGGIVDSSGNIFIIGTNAKSVDGFNVSRPLGKLAGANTYSSTCPDGTGTDARFKGISGIVIDDLDNIYVLDTIGQMGTTSCASTVRKITPSGIVSTLYTFSDGEVAGGRGLAMDAVGNLYYGVESGIKKLTPSGVETTYCGGTVSSGTLPNGKCSEAFLWYAGVVGFDSSGSLLFYETDASEEPNKYAFFKISP